MTASIKMVGGVVVITYQKTASAHYETVVHSPLVLHAARGERTRIKGENPWDPRPRSHKTDDMRKPTRRHKRSVDAKKRESELFALPFERHAADIEAMMESFMED